MDIKFKWVITSMECALNEGGLENVVKNVNWRLQAYVENEKYFAEVYGCQYFGSPEANNFTRFELLGKDEVVAWLKNVIDVDHYEEHLALLIDEQANPKVVLLNPPFEN